MTTSELIKGFEGFSPSPYRDGKGRWSIGYGSKHEAWMPQKISEGYASGLLEAEIKEIQHELLQRGYNYTGEKESALISFIYNTGAYGSELFKVINDENKGFEFWTSHYITSDGGKPNEALEKRRLKEAELFYGKITQDQNIAFSVVAFLLLLIGVIFFGANEI